MSEFGGVGFVPPFLTAALLKREKASLDALSRPVALLHGSLL